MPRGLRAAGLHAKSGRHALACAPRLLEHNTNCISHLLYTRTCESEASGGQLSGVHLRKQVPRRCACEEKPCYAVREYCPSPPHIAGVLQSRALKPDHPACKHVGVQDAGADPAGGASARRTVYSWRRPPSHGLRRAHRSILVDRGQGEATAELAATHLSGTSSDLQFSTMCQHDSGVFPSPGEQA